MEPKTPNDVIEQQLTKVMRRSNAIHVSTASGEVALERSSYGILCLLADEGPQRLGAIASAFHLDPSTVTRQAQAVVKLGLAAKKTDPGDRRATLLSLSDFGERSIMEARNFRRQALDLLLADWSAEDIAEFGRLLSKFNDTIDHWDNGAVPDEITNHPLAAPAPDGEPEA
ncbi:MarR family winged helix-turn-helix transcriptional regulator [Nocardioides jiangxiensis]|uniref:MarR family transcriptional regulator n=1 Tax=Nocardioides jiangxiensis TaxID=3064524 RepID=A0ABT9AYZ3_9ACTN|nr:MarR family transcriptional regulator [Nocardioides sp. WY-20]MDO7867163.1 MarR family transcriptional regulator [Nocardioides sp. WY-20]